MSTVVLGNGILGSRLSLGLNCRIISRQYDDFDITDIGSWADHLLECHHGVAFSRKYDTIVNCIACTDTYGDREPNWETNFRFVSDLVDFCNAYGIRLVQFSTDYIYAGSVKNASENDVPVHHQSWYSYSKLLGDGYVQLRAKNYLLIRATHKKSPWTYPVGWIDQIGNHDFIDNMVDLYVKLINSLAEGVYNVGTELKTTFELSLRDAVEGIKVTPDFAPSYVPKDLSMNLNKLHTYLKEQHYD